MFPLHGTTMLATMSHMSFLINGSLIIGCGCFSEGKRPADAAELPDAKKARRIGGRHRQTWRTTEQTCSVNYLSHSQKHLKFPLSLEIIN